jgi:hypothetical protein
MSDGDTSVATTIEIQELKSKIEQMIPLYDVGSLVRARKLEMCLPRSAQNPDITKAGLDIAFSGAALADATLFTDFAIKPYTGGFVYASRYGVSPAIVWENRDFSMLLDVLSMKLAMTSDFPRFSNQRDGFVADCNKFLNGVVPRTTVNTDEQVKDDGTLFAIYESVKDQYAKACEQYEQQKARKFSSAAR